uniref:Adenosine deaminase n=2 Tax=Dendroctonus ponderosae TaxID=77166 RepID=A0AAR5Q5M7_DENPD
MAPSWRVIVLNLLVIDWVNMSQSEDKYLHLRKIILKHERQEFMGADLNWTAREAEVDQYLLKLKRSELLDPAAFSAGESFLTAKEKIDKSKVFEFIRQIPKGASLHTHLLAAVSADYIIKNFTYEDNVYGCFNEQKIFKLRVLQDASQDRNCSWKSLKAYRREFEENQRNFDDFLNTQLVLDVRSLNQSKEEVWATFKNTFSTLYDLVSYKGFFGRFVFRLLEELYADNVIYTELRGTFMPIYELNGTTYDAGVFLDTFIQTVEAFKQLHPDFLGVKYIHNFFRGMSNEAFQAGLDQLISYKKSYPDFIAGLDFVGLEENGKCLVEFHEELLGVINHLKFFLHAGETDEFGGTDLNLVDAILLNSTRIGHGFALPKHPKLMKMVKSQNIAIELCPISNQVLKLLQNLRNHPATALLSKNYPVVVGNDDPSTWNASGLSYDWYYVLMAMTPEDQGLRVLKKLALNSIEYSAMGEKEKTRAFNVWNEQWSRFINNFANSVK